MELSNQVRQAHLRNERRLQILRNGIWVIFHRGRNLNFPSFQFDVQYQHMIKQWIDERYSLNIYQSTGFQQIYTLDKSNSYLMQNRVYMQNRNVDHFLEEDCCYILAKNNATILVLTRALEESGAVDQQINSFINDPNCLFLPQNKWFQLQEWAYHGLNPSQQKAIELVANQKIAFIKGPPGCGKTKTIARLATIFTYHRYQMMIGGVTNTANMTILHAILREASEMNYLPNIVLFINKQLYADSILHSPEIRPHTFRYKLIQNYMQLNEKQFLSEIEVQNLLDGYWSGKQTSRIFISIYYQAMAKIFQQANIVIITTTSAIKLDHKLDQDQKFKPFIGILDEASQASWADTCCFLVRGVQKMVFIGDDKQLTPTVISQNEVLKQTMFTTLFLKNNKYYVLLNLQYRMHPSISQFSNFYFYSNQIQNGVTSEERESHIQYFKQFPVSFINSQFLQSEQIQPKSGKKNYYNFGQVCLIRKILSFFPKEEFSKIGIISPYDLQIKMIAHFVGYQAFQYGLSARTCDGYQGSEKQYIILSCVRSNKEGKIGFCNEQNRLNVSITRARRGLVLVGNKATFLSETEEPNVWHKYLQYLEEKNLIVQQNILDRYPKFEHDFNKMPQITNVKQSEEELIKTAEKEFNEYKIEIQENQLENEKILPLQLELVDEQEEESITKVYKQFKKLLKNLMAKLKKSIIQLEKNENEEGLKLLMKEGKELRDQIRNIVKQYVYMKVQKETENIKKIKDRQKGQADSQREHKKIIRLTHKQLEKYTSLKQQAFKTRKQKNGEQSSEKQLQTKLVSQLQQKIGVMEKEKQFNHLRENKIIEECLGLSVCWALFQYSY